MVCVGFRLTTSYLLWEQRGTFHYYRMHGDGWCNDDVIVIVAGVHDHRPGHAEGGHRADKHDQSVAKRPKEGPLGATHLHRGDQRPDLPVSRPVAPHDADVDSGTEHATDYSGAWLMTSLLVCVLRLHIRTSHRVILVASHSPPPTLPPSTYY